MCEEADKVGIGARVRAARQRLGWTREVLAVRSGLSWSAVAQVESGRRTNLRPATLAGLAEALGVTTDYLIDGGAVKQPLLVHRALIYDSDESFAELAGGFLADGVRSGEGVIAVTTSRKISLLQDALGPDAAAVEFMESGEVLTSPGEAIATFQTAFEDILARGAPWIRALGEPIWEGRSEEEAREWVRFESIYNLAFAATPATVLCPYDVRAVDPEILRDAQATHPETVSTAGIAASETFADPAALVIAR